AGVRTAVRVGPGRAVVAGRPFEHSHVAGVLDRNPQTVETANPRGRLLTAVVDREDFVEVALDVRDDVRQPPDGRPDRVDPAGPLDRRALRSEEALAVERLQRRRLGRD